MAAGVALGMGHPAGAMALLAVTALLRPSPGMWRGPGPTYLGVATAALLGAGALMGAGASPAENRNGSGVGAGGRGDPGAAVRERLAEHVDRVFPEEGALVKALILADRSGLDREVRASFVTAGAAHLLAISGFHVGVLAGWVLLLLRSLPLRRLHATLGATLAVWAYVSLLGFPASATRAALILTAVAAGRLRGRPVHPLGAWGLALLIIVAADPEVVAAPGAQLSFAGALGLILWAERWTESLSGALARLRGIHRDQLVRWEGAVCAAVAASLAAQVATLPLATWHFQRVSVLALPATLAATPLVSAALPGALAALLLALLPLPGVSLVAEGVEGLLWLSRTVLTAMATLDPGWLLPPLTVVSVTAAAVLVRAGWRGGVGAVSAAALVALLWTPILTRGRGHSGLEIRLLDVGQGDAIAVGTPAGRWYLVDTGAGSGRWLARKLAAQGIPSLDGLVISHPDLDHMGAAAGLMEVFPVASLSGAGTVRGSGAYRAMIQTARRRSIPWRRLVAGDRWAVDGVTFSVLHPGPESGPESGPEPGPVRGSGAGTPPVNDRSVVLHLKWGELDVLLTGDISEEVEGALAPQLDAVEILKVAHHGSRTSTGDAFLDAVRPELAAISVGRNNRFGHPAPSVMARLARWGIPVVRTDRSGTVRILGEVDGSWQAMDRDGRELARSRSHDD